MGKKEKVCIVEDSCISPVEKEFLEELYATRGDKIREQELSEMFLLRFIRGYVNADDHKKAAFEVIDNYLAWAEEIDLQKIAATPFANRDQFFGKIWPSGFHGFSKDGHPIYIDRPGKVSPKVLSTLDMDEFTKMHIQSMEWLNDVKVRLSERTGRRIYKHVVIMDMEDFGFSHFGDKFRGPLKKIIDIDSTKYPESLSQMYIVNASFMFKAIWAIVSPWLDPITKTRITFLSKPKHLLEFIEADQLPDFLGGTCKYTEEKPCFVGEFVSGPGGHGELDDLYAGLLEARQANYEQRVAKKAEEEAKTKGDEEAAASTATGDGTESTEAAKTDAATGESKDETATTSEAKADAPTTEAASGTPSK